MVTDVTVINRINIGSDHMMVMGSVTLNTLDNVMCKYNVFVINTFLHRNFTLTKYRNVTFACQIITLRDPHVYCVNIMFL